MAKYAISPQGVQSFQSLAESLNSTMDNIKAANKSLQTNVESVMDSTGIYGLEIWNVTLKIGDTLSDGEESVNALIGAINKQVGEIEQLFGLVGTPSGGIANNSITKGGTEVVLSGGKSVDNTSTSMSRYATITGNHSIEMDLLSTNPNYSSENPDSPWNHNCRRCVSAYEARRRGYDVEAQPIPKGNDPLPIMLHPQGWPSVYKGGKLIDCSANSGTAAAINVENMMESWGDNCRAIVRVRWKPEAGGGGHVFIAERVNGVTRFIDPQNGTADASSYFQFAKGSGLFCMRIDNLDFTDRIHQCCQAK